MDRTVVRKATLGEEDEAFFLSLSPDERLRLIEELNRQGRIMAGYPASAFLDRKAVRVAG